MINLYHPFKIFYILIIIFWLFHIARRFFFWLYFWEKRGSRFDRFLNGIKENFRVLFSKSSAGAFLLLVFFPVLIRVNFLFESFVLFLYFVFGAYSVYLFIFSIISRDFSFHFFLVPKFKKETVYLAGVFLFLVFSFLGWGSFLIKENNFFLFLISLLIFEIFFPFLFIFSIFILNIFYFPFYKIFQIKAQRKLNQNKGLIKIAILGSYGKTLTKEFLAEILKEKFKVLKTKGGESSKKDIIRLINKELKNHQVLIFEVSAYRKGEIKKLFKILNPKISILSGISYDHIALFGDFDNLVNSYIEAFNSLGEDGIAILNIKDKEAQKIYQRVNCKKYSYSTSEEKGDVFAKDINIDFEKNNLSFSMVSPWGQERISLGFPFREYIENFLGSAICALELGINIGKVKEKAEKISLPSHFMEKKKTKKGVLIIDDTSSHNKESFLSALDHLNRIEGKKKIIIASPILELGKASYSIHNNIAKKIGEVCDFAIFTLPLFKKEIKLGAITSGMREDKILFLSDPREIFKKILPYFKKGNIILLEGEIPQIVKERILKM